MALTNAQYESIIREYEEKLNTSRHALEKRKQEIYDSIPEYAALENSAAELSVEYTRKIIDGVPGARQQLSVAISEISEKKKSLLQAHQYPSDYLEQTYECPDCKDTGYIGSVKCHCFEQRIIDLLYSQSNIRDVLQKENFQTLSYRYFAGDTLAAYKKTVDVCLAFVDRFDTEYKNLLFTGTVGSGKSFLSNCIAKALLDTAHSVIYFSAIDLFDTLSKNVFDKNKENLYSFYDDLYNCDLVIVDDLGTELPNAFVNSYFFALLNERNARSKSTLISTNLNLQEIEMRYSDRTFSRLISGYDICQFTCPDIRIQKKS